MKMELDKVLSYALILTRSRLRLLQKKYKTVMALNYVSAQYLYKLMEFYQILPTTHVLDEK